MSKMKPLTLEDIAGATGGEYIGPREAAGNTISSVVRDNREVTEGALFVAIKGERADGHDYIAPAFKMGAACCLSEKDVPEAGGPYVKVKSTLQALKDLGEYYRSLFSIPVVGVIGSVGKTTAKEMTAAVLSAKLNVLKTSVNLNNEIGVPLTLLRLREEHQAAVIEMGISEFGEMERLAKMVRPDICIMTNIGYCHLENLGDLNGVLKAKTEVFKYMKHSGLAIMNGDDALLRGYAPNTRKLTFGLGEANDWRAENVVSRGMETVSCDISGGGMKLHADIPAYGGHIVMAALPAAAAGASLGLTAEEIRRGIESYAVTGGRANVIKTGYLTIIDDCYNANPNSVAAAINSLRAVPGRRIAVLGDMKELGKNSGELHREIGCLCAQKGIDRIICTGEKAKYICEGCGGGEYFEDMESLLEKLPELTARGDTVLVKASHSMGFSRIVDRLRELK